MNAKAIGNHRSEWRARQVAFARLEKSLSPVKFNGNARRRIYGWKMTLLEKIRAEVAHKIAPEILAEVEIPAFRFKSASKRKTDGKLKGNIPHFYTMGGADSGADLSAANSVGHAMLAPAMD